jgi:hypothetical protein
MAQISEQAISRIIGYEVSSQAVYEQTLQYPTWPGGDSGVTIGIGCDLGYLTADEFRTMWGNRGVLPGVIETLAGVCGLTGQRARAAMSPAVEACTVPWIAATGVFFDVAIPAEIQKLLATMPGAELLNPDCLGALVSIQYNRGCAWRMTDQRHLEMREIWDAVGKGLLHEVPQLIRDMKRLWQGVPDMGGLLTRREDEAALFEAGLTAAGVPLKQPSAPEPPANPPQPPAVSEADEMNQQELDNLRSA